MNRDGWGGRHGHGIGEGRLKSTRTHVYGRVFNRNSVARDCGELRATVLELRAIVPN